MKRKSEVLSQLGVFVTLWRHFSSGFLAHLDYNSPAIFFGAKPAKTGESTFYFLEDDFFIPIFWEM